MKRSKQDIVFSDLVRERASWKCEYCGIYLEHDKVRLHCSHLFTRAYHIVRWHPDNAFANCATCHRRLENDPHEFGRWAEEKLSEERIGALRALVYSTLKLTKADKEDLHKHLRKEMRRLKDLRSDGHQGRLEFSGWQTA